MMRKRPLLTIAVANFHTWLQSSRVLSMLGCMVFYCLMQVVVDHSNYALDGEKTLLFNVPELLFLKLYSSFFYHGKSSFSCDGQRDPAALRFSKLYACSDLPNQMDTGASAS